MKRFEARKIRDAYKFSQAGGQALLIPGFACNWPGAPKCFRNKKYGYLLDQNYLRLKETASRLGVRVIKVDKQGDPQQHVNLCGRPLERAMKEAEVKK